MPRRLINVCFILVLGIPACERDKTLMSPRMATLQEIILIDDVFGQSLASDPAAIIDAGIEDDRLKLKIHYAGGSREHDFDLYGSRDGFLESYPVQTEIFLIHDAHGDPSEALITENRMFDLLPLRSIYQSRYGDTGSLLLRIFEPGDTVTFKVYIVYEF